MKTVLITGTSRGIGKALAEKFLAEGFFVIGTSRSIQVIDNNNFLSIPLEITNSSSRQSLVEILKSQKISIDILVNNAGIWDVRDEGPELNEEALRKTLEVNLIGPIACAESLIPFMNEGGHIVNVSSRRASLEQTSSAIYPAYSISKAGLNMFTRKLAARLSGKVIVSSIHPGSVKTEMNPEGELSVQESAQDIFNLVISHPQTGMFWYKGSSLTW